MEYVVYILDPATRTFVQVDEVENEQGLHAAFGERSKYMAVGEAGAIQVNHPFNLDRPMLAVPRAR
jgi:hypothetical protein